LNQQSTCAHEILPNKSFGAVCAPSELNSTIHLNVDVVLQLKRPLCSFAASWEALHILFELKILLSAGQELLSSWWYLLIASQGLLTSLMVLLNTSEESRTRVYLLTGQAAGVIELANWSRAAGKVKVADGSRATSKVGVAKHKPRPAGNIFWELLVAAIGCSAKESGSDFLLWHSPQV
jgi:hypothetical protein